ncbi:short-chain type dehydrogenase/reductase [Acrasis kona]|uniref:Short-chain type dehydrogenase/reductase n=1 Tax=Acrasis kona TaxID=1008807 RepID=A0AAW2ZKK0_9EUKA
MVQKTNIEELLGSFLTNDPEFIKTQHNDKYDAIDPKRFLSERSKDSTIFISGGAKGIGKAIALAFAETKAKNIIITSRDKSALKPTKEEINAISPDTNVITLSINVSDGESVKKAFEEISQHVDKIDVVINNAGTTAALMTTEDPEKWWGVQETNCKGTVLIAGHALPLLKKSKNPVIINTSSCASQLVYGGWSCYSTSKVFVNKYTEYLDVEYRKDLNLKAVAYHPGGIKTELATDKNVVDEEFLKLLVDEPGLPASFCVWFAYSPDSEFLSGRFVSAKWDVDELIANKDLIISKKLFKTKVDL